MPHESVHSSAPCFDCVSNKHVDAMECLQSSFGTKRRLNRDFGRPKGSRRTFTGCWSCRSRKVKCDEKVPNCTPCQKAGRSCDGYEADLVWVTPDQRTYQAGKRRFLDPRTTWKDVPILNSRFVDELIASCEVDAEHDEKIDVSRFPFTVFRPLGLEMLRRPSLYSSLNPDDARLLKFYETRLAPLLIPHQDEQHNPWSLYPKLALHHSNLGQKHLLHAVMAHAAIVLANTGFQKAFMLESGVRYYVLAMEELRTAIDQGTADYVGMLTTILTLLFIEVCIIF